MEMAPPSPSPGPSTSGDISVLGPETSSITMSSITHLPPDTQKFLRFAGKSLENYILFCTTYITSK